MPTGPPSASASSGATIVAYNTHGEVSSAQLELIGALSSQLASERGLYVCHDGTAAAFRRMQACLGEHAPAAQAVHTPWEDAIRPYPAAAAAVRHRRIRFSGRDLTSPRLLLLWARLRQLRPFAYVWSIERDAAFVGDARTFFASFSASTADLLTSMTVVIPRRSEPVGCKCKPSWITTPCAGARPRDADRHSRYRSCRQQCVSLSVDRDNLSAPHWSITPPLPTSRVATSRFD